MYRPFYMYLLSQVVTITNLYKKESQSLQNLYT
jgi:hypothetical protein